jgi:hypothetical protein
MSSPEDSSSSAFRAADPGDVELALFRARSSSSLTAHIPCSSAAAVASPLLPAFQRYAEDPLSLFLHRPLVASRLPPPLTEAYRPPDALPVIRQTLASTSSAAAIPLDPASAPAPSTHVLSNATSFNPEAVAIRRASLPAPTPPRFASTNIPPDTLVSQNSASQSSTVEGLVPESSWRDAMVTACADLLGRSMEQLRAEFDAIHSAAQSAAAAEAAVGVIPNSATSNVAASDPLLPRDLADHAIMATLKSRDTFAMQNAPSWLFNTMDRSGAGFVLRDEFIRYSPLMSPIADSAVALHCAGGRGSQGGRT